ncbi:MAG: hypothetical protein JXB07_18710 [Anaerolineae bacterium]|nr:hypothetical protein [Anaerolineae bacterium]
MDILNDFFAWAWLRHHNILSWYIRPFFLVPFCYFSYRRSWKGIAATIVALATSMFWFPTPDNPDPRVIAFLATEKEFLTGPWTTGKWVQTLLVPLSLILLGMAFWKRSLWYGLGIVNFIAVTKQLWSILYGGESGWAVLPPMLIGLIICNAAIILGVNRTEKRRHQEISRSKENNPA